MPLLRNNSATSSRKEEEEDAQICPCGKAIESRTHRVGECKICKEERDVLEERRKADQRDTDKFGTLDSRERTIAIPGERDGGHRRPNRNGVAAPVRNSLQVSPGMRESCRGGIETLRWRRR